MEAAGTSTSNFAEDTEANISKVVEASQTGAEAVDQMALEMEEAFTSLADTISGWQETYGLAMQKIIDSNLEVIESFNDMINALSTGNEKVTVTYDIQNSPEVTKSAGFDTGGYTGSWGPEGKLAVLHEKELILNQDDTPNMLKSLVLSKQILDIIDLNARQASLGLGQMAVASIKDDNAQTLKQEVHITAEFPTVTDHYEVEEALNNLINTASQYANRK